MLAMSESRLVASIMTVFPETLAPFFGLIIFALGEVFSTVVTIMAKVAVGEAATLLKDRARKNTTREVILTFLLKPKNHHFIFLLFLV